MRIPGNEITYMVVCEGNRPVTPKSVKRLCCERLAITAFYQTSSLETLLPCQRVPCFVSTDVHFPS